MEHNTCYCDNTKTKHLLLWLYQDKQSWSLFTNLNFYIVVFSTALYYCPDIPSIIIVACNVFAWLKFRNIAKSCTKSCSRSCTHFRKYFIWWNHFHFNVKTGSWNKAVVWSCSIDSIRKTINGYQDHILRNFHVLFLRKHEKRISHLYFSFFIYTAALVSKCNHN